MLENALFYRKKSEKSPQRWATLRWCPAAGALP